MQNKIQSFSSIVFDVDDTISTHTNRDYVNAKPIKPVIDKIKELKENGYTIVLATSRGQKSCKGDLAVIEKKNRKVLETWLDKHNVPYDELVFGKPLGALYVDDKSCDLPTFLNNKVQDLVGKNMGLSIEGGSGEPIMIEGDTVVKTCKNSVKQAQWLETALHMGVPTPKVITIGKTQYTMERVDGVSLVNSHNIEAFMKVLDAVDVMREIPDRNKIPFSKHIDKIHSRLGDYPELQKQVMFYNRSIQQTMDQQRSFCHEDLTLANVIVKDGSNDIVIIDPNNFGDNFSSWLMDISKTMMSCDSMYERDILGNQNNVVLPFFSKMIQERYSNFTYEIKVLQIGRLAQLLPYRPLEVHPIVIQKIEEIIDELRRS